MLFWIIFLCVFSILDLRLQSTMKTNKATIPVAIIPIIPISNSLIIYKITLSVIILFGMSSNLQVKENPIP